jgi:aspartyl-tRNA(Asn)/glutamyl-tRNA(Gln) amidotransferase subunit A
MTIEPLLALDAAELACRIAVKDVSPVEVVEASLARLEETDAQLNAYVAVDAAGAREAARRAEKAVLDGEPLPPLHGVPVSVKDLIDVAGLPARYGSLTLKDHVAPEDAPAVARLRAAGAIIVGKTATSEFGYRGYTKSLVHGNTRNPWDLGRTPGGSSGGAVASVAAGVTPIALGTDGGGSIRSPCAFTGLVGIKANYGRVAVWPPSATPTLAHVGPIARCVADAALLLRTVAGPHTGDPSSFLPTLAEEPHEGSLRGLRVAYAPTLGYAHVDTPVADTVGAAVKRLATAFRQIDVVEHVCPDPAEILAAEFIGGCSARLGDIVDTAPDLIDPPLLEAIKAFRASTSDRFTRLLRRRLEHREVLRNFFERYDVLLTPTTPCLPWDIDRGLPAGFETATVWSFFTYPFNLSGQPAASLPCGLDAHGLPVGLQVVVPLLREDRLLAVLRVAERLLGRSPTPIETDGR